MNTKQINKLRSLLKKYQYKTVSNRVRQAMGINYENFLQKTEPLYVVPRIASCYREEDKRKELMGIVYKEWLKDVVEKHWVEPLNAYSDEHGERLVLSAIYYLIDNNLWEVYEGRLALDAQEHGYYDKLGDMPSAIAMVKETQAKEQEAAEKEKQSSSDSKEGQGEVKPQDTSSGDGSNNQKPDWWNDPDYILNADEAMSLMGATDEMFSHLSQNMKRLANYIYTAADSDVLRKKISDQQSELENEKAAHQKQVSDLQVQIDQYKAKIDDAKATATKASDYISKLRQELSAKEAEAQKEYDELNAKYKKALDERDDADKELAACRKLLDEEANKEQLPKKKVIPYSVLDSVPLLGKGVMTGLVPVLARYNIVVDYNR